ncbi:MAG: hypothetical protein LBN30_03355 [Oscillospiraceae bacterium]|jgi:hypothetical protein|nr:hypothetical protein [Oscillospiraceae bacterium]
MPRKKIIDEIPSDEFVEEQEIFEETAANSDAGEPAIVAESAEEVTIEDTVSDATETIPDYELIADDSEPINTDEPVEDTTEPETAIEFADEPPAEPVATPQTISVKPTAKPRKKSFFDLKLNELDRDLSEEQRAEWNGIYASYRAKSVLSGTVIGADRNTFEVVNRDTRAVEKKTLTTLIVIDYRVKILIPETELWAAGDERPSHLVNGLVGAKIDFIIMEVDRENECAVASRRMALSARQHFFSRGEHREGELLKCNILAVGAKQLSAECNGYDLHLTQRDLSYTSIADLRAQYRPGQELTCRLTEYDRKSGKLAVSVKEVNPNPFVGADRRHPVGSRRQATISGKYAGGVFCNLPDGAVCLCLYSSRHADADFRIGDEVILLISRYDYGRELIFGRILAKW